MSKNIQNKIADVANQYAKQFKQLNGLVEAVRQMPGMYIGGIGKLGFTNMIKEIFQNGGDQILRKDSPCDTVFVDYRESDMQVCIWDNGLGIPFYSPDFNFNLYDIFIAEHLSTNYEKEPFQFTSGRHGIGSKVTNVLSEYFVVESFGDGKGLMCRFEEGQLVIPDTPIPNPDNIHGLRVTFKPSRFMELNELNRLTSVELLDYIRSLVPQLEIGAKVVFHSTNIDGTTFDETIINEDGIYTHMYMATTNPLVAPIRITDNTDGYHKADIVITYDLDASVSPNVIAFGNTCPIDMKSTPCIGAVDGVVRFFRQYMNKVFLANSKKKNTLVIQPNDIKVGLLMALSVYHLNPIFRSQDKNEITNEDFTPYMSNLVYNGLTEWAKTNPKDLQRICSYIKDMAELRIKTEESKVKVTDKLQQSSTTGLPKKYLRPTSNNPKDKLELWIVEGDSVAGQARVSRNRRNQGIFPIRGKIINALTNPMTKVLSNQEVQSIITIQNAGYGKSFDIEKLMFDKIIFGSDADAQHRALCTVMYIENSVNL